MLYPILYEKSVCHIRVTTYKMFMPKKHSLLKRSVSISSVQYYSIKPTLLLHATFIDKTSFTRQSMEI